MKHAWLDVVSPGEALLDSGVWLVAVLVVVVVVVAAVIIRRRKK